MRPINGKAVYTLVLFHILIYPPEFLDRIGSQLVTAYLILVNLQAVEGGKKCCLTEKSGGNFYWLPLDKSNTVALTGNLKGIFTTIFSSVFLIHKSFSISWIIRKLIFIPLVIMLRTGNKCCTAE